MKVVVAVISAIVINTVSMVITVMMMKTQA